jgi:hypothetical protein
MGRAYSWHGKDEKLIQNFGWKKLKGRDHLENLDTECRITLELNLDILIWGGGGCQPDS